MASFYALSANRIGRDDFVRLYSGSYYIGSDNAVPGVSQNSRFVEEVIDAILRNGIETEIDVAKILAWKIGKIKHAESERAKDFCYASDWAGAEELSVMRYGRPFDLKDIASYIVDNIAMLQELSEDNPQEVLNRLRSCGVRGIGTVYMITLLYFISKGRYPIYDRFAMMALSAIASGIEPGGSVEYKELPSKDSKARFESVYVDCMVPYIKLLTELFGENAVQDRDVDRALWVYGHCFKQA